MTQPFQVSALVALAESGPGHWPPRPTFAFIDQPWVAQALCAQVDYEIFFPEVGSSSPRDAKKVCMGCDVRGECLEYALTHDEFGIWGGLTARERRKLHPPVPVVRTIPCLVPGCPNFFATELGRDRHVRRSPTHVKRAS